MRIAVLTASFPVISETFIVEQIINLLELGNQVEVFSLNRSREKIIQSTIIKYHLLKRVTYAFPENRLVKVFKLFYILLWFLLFRKELLYKYWKFSFNIKLVAKLNRLFVLYFFAKTNYDIIHCHFGDNANEIIFLRGLVKAKICVTFHGYDISSLLRKTSTNIYKDLFLKADLFLPVSKYFKNRLIELGCPSEKIKIHYLGIDTVRFYYKDRDFDFKKDLKVLTVGRLTEKKGVKYAISALALVKKQFPNIMYTIIGEGGMRLELEQLIKDLSLQDVVKIKGALSQDEIIKYYYSSDFFILPSITAQNGDQEGIPITLNEAMATGMVVISTYHSGIPELISDNESGFLVKEKDIISLVEKLKYLIDNPDACKRISLAGRKIIEERFDTKQKNRELFDIFKEIH